MLLWTWVYRYLLETLLSTFLDIYPEVKLLDHMVILFLIFWRPAITVLQVAALFYIPTSSARSFLYILADTSYFPLKKKNSQSKGSEVVSYYGFDLYFPNKHLFLCLLGICVSSLDKCLLQYFVHFKIRLIFLLLRCTKFFIYSGYEPLIIYMICKYFLLFHWLPFSLCW